MDSKKSFLQQVKSDASSTLKQLKNIMMQPSASSPTTTAPTTTTKNAHVFGKSLSQCSLTNQEGIPRIMVDTIAYLTRECLALEGIFRVPGSLAEIRHIKDLYDQGATQVDFSDLDLCKTPHTVSALLKLYLRELAEPLLTFELYDCFIAADSIVVEEARKECIKKILGLLPAQQLNVFEYLLRFLHLVSTQASVNKMTAANLAMVFAPNLFQSRQDGVDLIETPQATRVLEMLIRDYDYFFAEFRPFVIERNSEVAADALDAGSLSGSVDVNNAQEDHMVKVERAIRKLNTKVRQTLGKGNVVEEDRPASRSSSHHSLQDLKAVTPPPPITLVSATAELPTPPQTGAQASLIRSTRVLKGPRENPFHLHTHST